MVLSLWYKTTSVFLRSARYLRLGEYLTSCAKRLECVLASSPENVLFVLGVGVEWGSNPLLRHGIHSAARLFYNRPQSLFGARYYELTCRQSPGQEGGVFAQHNPLGACVQCSPAWVQIPVSIWSKQVYETRLGTGPSAILLN